MNRSRAALYRGLVIYYGLVQSVHLASIGWDGANYLETGRLTLLAPPPPGGWPGTALAALLAMGLADSLIILASLAFVWGTLKGRPWSRGLGTAVLSGFMVTALAFAVVTLPSGVWGLHAVYWVEGLLFVPIAVLTLLHLVRTLGSEQGGDRGNRAV